MSVDADKLLSPWIPMKKPIDLKILGKLLEELGEATAAISRCVIQGIDEVEPITNKPNIEWLEDELADVIAGINIATAHFALDEERMNDRAEKKMKRLLKWHRMLA